MISILSSFENRLSKLEETVLPLKNETENLQLQQKSKSDVGYIIININRKMPFRVFYNVLAKVL